MTETDELLKERYALAYERIKEIRYEKAVTEPYSSFFSGEACFLTCLFEKYEELYGKNTCENAESDRTPDGIEEFYEELHSKAYEQSYGNPVYAASVFGEEYGTLFCWLYAEITGAAAFALGNRPEDLTVAAELFLEIYNGFIYEEIITKEQFLSIIYSYNYDYCAEFTEQYIDELAGIAAWPEVPGSLPTRSIDLCMPIAGMYEDGGKYAGYLKDHKYDCGLYLDDRLVTARLQALRNSLKNDKYSALRKQLADKLSGRKPQNAILNNAVGRLSAKNRKLLEKYLSESSQIIGRFVNGGEV